MELLDESIEKKRRASLKPGKFVEEVIQTGDLFDFGLPVIPLMYTQQQKKELNLEMFEDDSPRVKQQTPNSFSKIKQDFPDLMRDSIEIKKNEFFRNNSNSNDSG